MALVIHVNLGGVWVPICRVSRAWSASVKEVSTRTDTLENRAGIRLNFAHRDDAANSIVVVLAVTILIAIVAVSPTWRTHVPSGRRTLIGVGVTERVGSARDKAEKADKQQESLNELSFHGSILSGLCSRCCGCWVNGGF